MPFGVTKYPRKCDPRNACFCIDGYAWGAVPPYRYEVFSLGATGEFFPLNAGVMIEFNNPSSSGCVFLNTASSPLPAINFETAALANWQTVPDPDPTLEWRLTIRDSLQQELKATLSARFPVAVNAPPDFFVVPNSTSQGTIPNRVQVLPRAWDAT